MTGGLMKTTVSRLALAAIASVVATGAMAADLGGNCCADLEERVSELEATTARKGNRKMSLTVSGQVNKHLVWHDSNALDARRSDDFSIQDNEASQSRFRFVGSAKIDADRTVGYVMEIGITENQGVSLSSTSTLSRIRQNHVYIQSATLGKLSLGQQSTATDGVWDISLANIRQMDTGGAAGPVFLTGGNLASTWLSFNGPRVQAVRYDSPVFAGFTLSASWGHAVPAAVDTVDDEVGIWDVALRYAGEFNGVRLAAGAGYREVELVGTAAPGDLDKEKVWVGSGSIMHVPTGLFVSGGVASRDRGDNSAGDDAVSWHGQLGIERNWFGIGNTTIFGEYGSTEFDIEGVTSFNNGTFWGIGFVQSISAAASDVYLGYRSFEADNLAGVGRGDEVNVFQAGMIVRF